MRKMLELIVAGAIAGAALIGCESRPMPVEQKVELALKDKSFSDAWGDSGLAHGLINNLFVLESSWQDVQAQLAENQRRIVYAAADEYSNCGKFEHAFILYDLLQDRQSMQAAALGAFMAPYSLDDNLFRDESQAEFLLERADIVLDAAHHKARGDAFLRLSKSRAEEKEYLRADDMGQALSEYTKANAVEDIRAIAQTALREKRLQLAVEAYALLKDYESLRTIAEQFEKSGKLDDAFWVYHNHKFDAAKARALAVENFIKKDQYGNLLKELKMEIDSLLWNQRADYQMREQNFAAAGKAYARAGNENGLRSALKASIGEECVQGENNHTPTLQHVIQ